MPPNVCLCIMYVFRMAMSRSAQQRSMFLMNLFMLYVEKGGIRHRYTISLVRSVRCGAMHTRADQPVAVDEVAANENHIRTSVIYHNHIIGGREPWLERESVRQCFGCLCASVMLRRHYG